ncbi:gluconokinase [Streptomyces albus subsp. chlorinus]|uniref:gluconokinase n=1 Tax=Streptomyces albus TaxID=1888 RepID=UPI00156F3A1C|nr:gluconokinase [Streptomyces albus]NSC22820.1 gluconokinase [Streptomyces albus subsp. chlorinus]
MTYRNVVVVMGVAGTGKTTVGRLLAEALDVPYAEADAFHPPANVAKMSAGTPLDDADRAPWLDAIGAWAHGREGRGGVVSCSALKRAYRDRLRAAAPGLVFVHLTGDRALIARRMAERAGHFMPVALLDSQFATLEPLEPDERGVAVSVAAGPRAVADQALAALRAADHRTAAPATAAPATAAPATPADP